jgi:Bacterial protein of unknown function (DUF898)
VQSWGSVSPKRGIAATSTSRVALSNSGYSVGSRRAARLWNRDSGFWCTSASAIAAAPTSCAPLARAPLTPAPQAGTVRRADAGMDSIRILKYLFLNNFYTWIAHVFCTLITLGVYSTWAKVRKRRYFYGSTRIDGDAFDYFGGQKAILKGRIVAAPLFLLYAFAAERYPLSRFVFMAAFVLVLPWLVVRTLAFNARNSAYRSVLFDFVATPREAVPIFIASHIPLKSEAALGRQSLNVLIIIFCSPPGGARGAAADAARAFHGDRARRARHHAVAAAVSREHGRRRRCLRAGQGLEQRTRNAGHAGARTGRCAPSPHAVVPAAKPCH